LKRRKKIRHHHRLPKGLQNPTRHYIADLFGHLWGNKIFVMYVAFMTDAQMCVRDFIPFSGCIKGEK
jgi:hypothetical protein